MAGWKWRWRNGPDLTDAWDEEPDGHVRNAVRDLAAQGQLTSRDVARALKAQGFEADPASIERALKGLAADGEITPQGHEPRSGRGAPRKRWGRSEDAQ